MKATCTLCGAPLEAEPDNILDSQRDDRTFGKLGSLLRKHIRERHANEPQTAIDHPELHGGTINQLSNIVAITAQASLMYSYVQCEDPAFQLRIEKMREIVQKAIEQKKAPPKVVSPSLVV